MLHLNANIYFCYRSNEVQEHVNKDDSAEVPLFIQFDRKCAL